MVFQFGPWSTGDSEEVCGVLPLLYGVVSDSTRLDTISQRQSELHSKSSAFVKARRFANISLWTTSYINLHWLEIMAKGRKTKVLALLFSS